MNAGFKQEVRFARTRDGVRIAYAIAGSGYPLIRTAHWMTNIESDWRTPMFGPWFARLASQYQLYRYDQRGSGMSDGLDLPLSVEAYVSDLEAVIDAAKLDRFALLGPSGGSLSAIAYAARHPHRVTHLILVGGFAKGALRRNLTPEDRERFMLGVRAIELGWGQDDPSFLQLFTSQFFPGATLEYMRAFNDMQRDSCPPQQAAAVAIANGEGDVSSLLEKVVCPTLVMHCRGDIRVPIEQGRLLAAAVRDARFVSLDSRNHVPLANEPEFERMFQEIEAFLPPSAAAQAASTPFPDLTPREHGILDLIARGLDNLQIAAHLSISEKTVRNNITAIFDKLAVENRSQAIVKAREAGLGR